jgi:chemotaxis family two-component system response regulator Rcp1
MAATSGSSPDPDWAGILPHSPIGKVISMSIPDTGRSLEILLVEDDPGDVRLTVEVLGGKNGRHLLRVVTDGEEALDFLRQGPQYLYATRPDVVLLDLNLPKRHGFEVLAEMKKDEQLRQIPVVILTSSGNEADIRKAYDLQANCYIRKPVGLAEFNAAMCSLIEFWSKTVILPRNESGRDEYQSHQSIAARG